MNENQSLVVLNNNAALVAMEKMKALSNLFQLTPEVLELVSKTTTKEGATPGTFRVSSTGESFKEVHVVMLFDPSTQRENKTKWSPGQTGGDFKECFSLDGVQPHARAKHPPSLYCATCPASKDNNKAWEGWRKAKERGVTGDSLSALIPPCGRFWHLILANRDTQAVYYFNVKNKNNLESFEAAMKTLVNSLRSTVKTIERQNNTIIEENSKLGPEQQKPLIVMPSELCHVTFTMFAHQPVKGGHWVLGFKDFSVLNPKDREEFGKIVDEYNARRTARAQTQVPSETEEVEAAMVSEAPSAPSAASEVAAKNKMIQI